MSDSELRNKGEEPLVSVIVPCYNHADFIEVCVKSICRQTYGNIELIVLDDGSSDGSDKVLQELNSQYDFYYEHQENMGLCNTLNKGLSLCKGEYVCCFASDDVMMLDRIEKQVTVMQGNPQAGACSGNVISINSKGETLTKQKMIPSRELKFDDIFYKRTRGVSAPTVMISKKTLDKVGGYDPEIKIEDLYMWLKITKAGYSIIHSSDIYSYYRQHDNSTHSNIRSMFENEKKILEIYKDEPNYEDVLNALIVRTFVKASQADKNLAKQLLRIFPISHHPIKFLKGLHRLIS